MGQANNGMPADYQACFKDQVNWRMPITLLSFCVRGLVGGR